MYSMYYTILYIQSISHSKLIAVLYCVLYVSNVIDIVTYMNNLNVYIYIYMCMCLNIYIYMCVCVSVLVYVCISLATLFELN